jgi:hypothetical protein
MIRLQNLKLSLNMPRKPTKPTPPTPKSKISIHKLTKNIRKYLEYPLILLLKKRKRVLMSLQLLRKNKINMLTFHLQPLLLPLSLNM